MLHVSPSKMALGLLAAIGIAMPAIAHAQATIVRTSGPSAAANKVGTRLPEGAKIKLQERDRITVLGKSGTRVFVGPGTFVIGSNSSTQPRTSMAVFVSRSGAMQRVRAGAIRGPKSNDQGAPVPAPGIWLLETGTTGKFCRDSGSSLFVWRPAADSPATAKISADGWEYFADMEWDPKSRIKKWPADEAPVDEGQTYHFTPPGTEDSHDITFVTIDNPPTDPEALFDLFLEKGCTDQVTRMADEAEATGEGGDEPAAD